jgi:argininosuccinate lyase
VFFAGFGSLDLRKEPALSSPSRSGAFQEAVDHRVELFTESVSFDQRLYRQDVAGSVAHAHMLADQGVLTADEAGQIQAALEEIQQKIEAGEFEYRTELEDIHMHIEHALIERLGDVGRKLHTGRSRNDQVSTDFRLWVRDALDKTDALLLELQRSFLSRTSVD